MENKTILISDKKRRMNERHINLKYPLFEGSAIVVITDTYISFERPGLDTRNARKLTRIKRERPEHYLGITDDRLQLGRFTFDEEESNEDYLIAYFED